jgi:ComF family protein
MAILLEKRSLLPAARRLIGALADRLFAQDCLLCGAPSGDRILCSACEADLPTLTGKACPRCALPTPSGELCGRCLSKPPHFDETLALFEYAFPVDRLIQSFKYSHRLALGPFFGHRLAERAAGLQADRMLPLPLHPSRLAERGFNQAIELARPVAKALGVPLDVECCRRTRKTEPQAGLPWKERAKNIRGAFHCTEDLSGQHIVLIDDVMTTGASLDECARTLKLHGAAHVTLLVVARALP